MFLDTWSAVGRVVLLGATAFLSVVVLLRLSGKRTPRDDERLRPGGHRRAGVNARTILLSEQVVLVEGVTALAVLVARGRLLPAARR